MNALKNPISQLLSHILLHKQDKEVRICSICRRLQQHLYASIEAREREELGITTFIKKKVNEEKTEVEKPSARIFVAKSL